MIEVQNLVKAFGNPPQQIIKNLSFTIQPGEFVSIWGRSGSGKTTLLYMLSTLDKPTSGQVKLDGEVTHLLSEKSLHDFRNQNIGFIFQFHYLLPELSALENVLLPARRNQSYKQYTQRALMLLDRVGLTGKEHRLPSQLSGGEQQRVAIARSLIMRPKFLFADEPTGSLDSNNGQKVMNLLVEAQKEYNMTLILVTHEKEYAQMAQRKIYLRDGEIVNVDQM